MTRRLQVLFVAVLLGVLACGGLLLAELAGGGAAAVYALVVVGLVLAVGARARRRELAEARRRDGRTCSCCTGSQHDPVQVV